jgi:hypothetical protein
VFRHGPPSADLKRRTRTAEQATSRDCAVSGAGDTGLLLPAPAAVPSPSADGHTKETSFELKRGQFKLQGLGKLSGLSRFQAPEVCRRRNHRLVVTLLSSEGSRWPPRRIRKVRANFRYPCELLSFSSPCPLSCADLYAACYEIAVVVHVRSTGDAPILKQSKFKVRVPSSRGPIICFRFPVRSVYSPYSWEGGFGDRTS